MNIWLIKTGEPLPTDGQKVRLFRAGIFAEYLADNGHRVTWWSSIFDHQNKVHRKITDDPIELNKNLKLIALRSDGYIRNISIQRIIDHRQVAKKFTIIAKRTPPPDIILTAFPTIELCNAAIEYGEQNNVPVFIDIRDLWPDIFIEHIFPKFLRPLGSIIIKPYSIQVHKIMKKATGLISISGPMLKWGLKYAHREKKEADNIFPFGYYKKYISNKERIKAKNIFKKIGIFEDKVSLRICLFATLNNSYELITLIKALEILQKKQANIQLVICGKGEKLTYYINESKDLDNVYFSGWVDFPTIQYLMDISDLGIAPYINTTDFASSIPNKAIEYFSGGLPILTSINGHLTKILQENNCGWFYENGNPQQLANIILKIENDRNKLSRMQNNATKIFNEKFEAFKVYKNFMDHIILNSKS